MYQRFIAKSQLIFVLVLFALCSTAQGQLGTFDSLYYKGKGIDNITRGGLVLPDSSIIVTGKFVFANERMINGIVKLTSNGDIDYSFNPGTGADDNVNVVVRQPDGKLLIGGDFIKFNGQTKNRIARLNPDGSLDATFNTGIGCNQSVYAIYQQPDGKILLGGNFSIYNGDTLGYFVRLNNNGSRDTSFHVGKGFSFSVYSVDRQADGKYIVGGDFKLYQKDTVFRVARIDSTGNLDTTFGNRKLGASAVVNNANVLPNGKIILAGAFGTYNGSFSPGIARLFPDGKIDSSFTVGTGFNLNVNELCFQPDGKIIATGNFTSYAGAAITRIARIDTNGLRDASFNPGTGPNLSCNAVFLSPDGKVYVGGTFIQIDSFFRLHFARLLPTGKVDQSFFRDSKINGAVSCIGFQSNGKSIIGGAHTKYNEVSSNRIARLNLDGSLDAGFLSGTGANSNIRSIVVLPNDKILIAGDFTNYNGTNVNRIARLNANGTIDNTFTIGTGSNNSIYSMVVLPNGKIVITGTFTIYNTVAINRIARLNSNGTLDNTFAVGTGLNGQGTDLALQNDGQIIVAGSFTLYNGAVRNRIVRIDTLGGIDINYASGVGANNLLTAVVLQPDGKAIIAGLFSTYNGAARGRIARLKVDGTLDSTYNASVTGGQINDMAYLKNTAFFPGGLVIAGTFTAVNNVTQFRLSFLNDNGNIDSVNFYKGAGINGTVNVVTINTFGKKIMLGGDFNASHLHVSNRVAAFECSSIRLTKVANTVLCPGAITSVQFNYEQTFYGNNYFRVQLSDSSGNFSNPVTIGSLSAVDPGTATIPVTIPLNTPFGFNYKLRIISTNPGDTSTVSETLIINTPVAPTVAVSGPIVFCQGLNTMLTASAASQYIWSTGDTTQSISVHNTDSYTVTVSTANCSAGSVPVNIIVKPAPDSTLVKTPSFCNGGQVTLTAAPNFTYGWNNAATTRAITAGQSGTYSVTITSANGCISTPSIQVDLDSILNTDIEAAGATTFCAGGSVILSAKPGFAYSWSNGASTQSIVASASGNYIVTVSDGTCTDSSSIIHVTVRPLPVITFALAADTICNNSGQIILQASPGGGTFTGQGVSGSTFNPQTYGNNHLVFTYSYTDGNSCSAIKSDSMYVAICTGVEEVFENALQLYPNPAKNDLYISTVDMNLKTAEIFNLMGESVLLVNAPNVTNHLAIDISSLAAGNYFVKAGDRKFRFVKGE